MIAGQRFVHLLCVFVLPYSDWRARGARTATQNNKLRVRQGRRRGDRTAAIDDVGSLCGGSPDRG
jgi:hypothetical protein